MENVDKDAGPLDMQSSSVRHTRTLTLTLWAMPYVSVTLLRSDMAVYITLCTIKKKKKKIEMTESKGVSQLPHNYEVWSL